MNHRKPYTTRRVLIAQEIRERWGAYVAYAIVLGACPNEAEDLCAEAFYRAFRAHRSLRRDVPLMPWLKSVISRLRVDRWRRSRYQYAEDRTCELIAVNDAPDKLLETAETASLVRDALRALPVEQAWTVRHIALRGRTYEETARRTGVPLGTVRSRYSRGITAIAAAVGPVLGMEAA